MAPMQGTPSGFPVSCKVVPEGFASLYTGCRFSPLASLPRAPTANDLGL